MPTNKARRSIDMISSGFDAELHLRPKGSAFANSRYTKKGGVCATWATRLRRRLANAEKRGKPTKWPDLMLWRRSEEHTSELQSLMRISYAVFCLKKKHVSTDSYMRRIKLLQ